MTRVFKKYTEVLMSEINWYGNDGLCILAPGSVETLKCDVCYAPMDVTRDVPGVTKLSGKQSTYDSFLCPHREETWHKHIRHVKREVSRAQTDCEYCFMKMKETARVEIEEILKTHPAR